MSEMTTWRKAGYVAVGFPVHLVNNIRTRMAGIADQIDEARNRASAKAHHNIDEWMEEGEQVIGSLRTKAENKRASVEESARKTAHTAGDVGRGLAATLTSPLLSLDEIEGIGPAYAEALERAGVVSVTALVERCRSAEAIDRLAEQTSIPTALIARWVESADLTRVKGIGEDYMSLLNALGVGSLQALAEQDPSDLWARAQEKNDRDELVGLVPSAATFADWVGQAEALRP